MCFKLVFDHIPWEFKLGHSFDLNVVFQGRKGEGGLPGVDGLPGPQVRTISFWLKAEYMLLMQIGNTNDPLLVYTLFFHLNDLLRRN